MPLADYAHHNEEAERIWWEEEGRHDEPNPTVAEEAAHDDAADAFFEEHAETPSATLRATLRDEDYCARWPEAAKCIRWILEDRGEGI